MDLYFNSVRWGKSGPQGSGVPEFRAPATMGRHTRKEDKTLHGVQAGPGAISSAPQDPLNKLGLQLQERTPASNKFALFLSAHFLRGHPGNVAEDGSCQHPVWASMLSPQSRRPLLPSLRKPLCVGV